MSLFVWSTGQIVLVFFLSNRQRTPKRVSREVVGWLKANICYHFVSSRPNISVPHAVSDTVRSVLRTNSSLNHVIRNAPHCKSVIDADCETRLMAIHRWKWASVLAWRWLLIKSGWLISVWRFGNGTNGTTWIFGAATVGLSTISFMK